MKKKRTKDRRLKKNVVAKTLANDTDNIDSTNGLAVTVSETHSIADIRTTFPNPKSDLTCATVTRFSAKDYLGSAATFSPFSNLTSDLAKATALRATVTGFSAKDYLGSAATFSTFSNLASDLAKATALRATVTGFSAKDYLGPAATHGAFSNLVSDLANSKVLAAALGISAKNYLATTTSIGTFSNFAVDYGNTSRLMRDIKSGIFHNAGLSDFIKENLADVEETDIYSYNLELDDSSISESDKKDIIIIEKKLIKSINDIYENNENIFNLIPREFEELIAELMHAQGFQVELTKQTRDGGRDIIAIKTQNGYYDKYLIECKKYTTTKITPTIIRSLLHVVQDQKANKGIIATTAKYPKIPKEFEQYSPWLLQIKDQSEIIKWVQEYYIKHICKIDTPITELIGL